MVRGILLSSTGKRIAWFFVAALVVVVAALLTRAELAEIDVSESVARVEKLRGLKFEEVPKAVLVSQETASDDVWTMPEAREAMLELLGLVGWGEDLEEGGGVYGSYAVGENRIEIADDGPRSGPLFEVNLAHEVMHALDDQHFGFVDTEEMNDDAAMAAEALAEGSAMLIERLYAERHLGGRRPDEGEWRTDFVSRDARFVYEKGEAFVAALRAEAGGRWTRVDTASRSEPPRSSEQVLHPEKWLAKEWPVVVDPPRVNLGAGWKRVDTDVWGEWRTGAIVGERLALGWGGDRFELWRRGDQHTLVMTWAWDTEAGARALAAGLRARPFMHRPGAQVWREGEEVTLVLAPSDALAALVG